MAKDKIKILLDDEQEIECDKLIAFMVKEDELDFGKSLITEQWNVEELGKVFLYLKDLIDKEIYDSLNPKGKQLFDSIQNQREVLERELYSSLNDSEQKLYQKVYQKENLEVSDANLSNEFDQEIEKFFDDLLNDIQDKDKKYNDSSTEDDNKVINLAEFKNKKGR